MERSNPDVRLRDEASQTGVQGVAAYPAFRTQRDRFMASQGFVYHYYSGRMTRDILLTTHNRNVACLIGMSPRYQDGEGAYTKARARAS